MRGDADVHPLRLLSWPLGLAYGAVAALRNRAFDAGLRRVHRLGVPVVSIGNLTVGGTGKTPAVAWLCELAKARGRRPGVLARGYGRAPGSELNDEGAMLQKRLPWLLQEQDPDRVAAGARLVQRGADFVVLDDGFQHRRLHRDVDVVCVDAVSPFGNGCCLPAGDLREHRSGLRRASIVLLTRAGALSPAELSRRLEHVRAASGGHARVYACDHAPVDVVEAPSTRVHGLDALRGRPVVLLSAIARPRAFRALVERLGGVVAAELRHRDHHRFTADDVAAAAAAATRASAWLLTTEKDDARLGTSDVPRYVLRIELRFLGEPPPPAELLL